MSCFVIDTNVLLVANGMAGQMSDCCRIECIARLDTARDRDTVVLDWSFLILGEYQKKLNPNRRPQPGPGDAFVKHLLQNMANPHVVERVGLTPIGNSGTDFAEFPESDYLRKVFDPADRKFVATANAHSAKPPIVQSADTKWLDWEAELRKHDIRLEVLCRGDLEATHKKRAERTYAKWRKKHASGK